jgi:hypothetical protein
MEVIEAYQSYFAFGFLLNIISTIGFGIYKASNISEAEALYLITTYEAKTNMTKIVVLWCIPFLGFLYVFKEVFMLQISYLNRGLSVFNYVEDKIKKNNKKRR